MLMLLWICFKIVSPILYAVLLHWMVLCFYCAFSLYCASSLLVALRGCPAAGQQLCTCEFCCNEHIRCKDSISRVLAGDDNCLQHPPLQLVFCCCQDRKELLLAHSGARQSEVKVSMAVCPASTAEVHIYMLLLVRPKYV